MKKLKMRLRLAAVLLLVALSLASASVFAAVGDVPTLFHNDEEWYKDGLYPMSVREGDHYIPAELFSMFDYISVTTPFENNVLIHNTESDQYVSILFKDASAAVNGNIIRDIGVFRDGEMYYVPAELVCGAIGMKYEIYTAENGKQSLRLYDDDHNAAFETLINEYLPDESGGEDTTVNEQTGRTKRIFLLCKTAGMYPSEYSAQRHLDAYGLNYTVFLTSGIEWQDIVLGSAHGEYGVLPKNQKRVDGIDMAEELDSLNLFIKGYTNKKSRLTLSTGNDEEDGILRNHGYIPIKPDFTVNGSSDAETLFSEIMLRATKNGSCVVYLEDCWNSARIAELISEIFDPSYITSNLINANR